MTRSSTCRAAEFDAREDACRRVKSPSYRSFGTNDASPPAGSRQARFSVELDKGLQPRYAGNPAIAGELSVDVEVVERFGAVLVGWAAVGAGGLQPVLRKTAVLLSAPGQSWRSASHAPRASRSLAWIDAGC